ncbi:hypothetical protein Pint_03288 [Pistacia integerrima]|uniref:Uncharacterized protein n=1 Tax=Pistacia integerrima TaxID=434235 RepID=A0ACC0ZJM8_9ROSI|nr:hypothetical protein Pint_03288 [Pistacia integerrima]
MQAKIHVYFLTVYIFLGILCFCYGLCLLVCKCHRVTLCKCRGATQLVLKVGIAATTYALVATVRHLFPLKVMYLGTFVLLAVCTLPILCFIWRY